MNRGISYSGKRIRIKAVKYYVIAGQLIKPKIFANLVLHK